MGNSQYNRGVLWKRASINNGESSRTQLSRFSIYLVSILTVVRHSTALHFEKFIRQRLLYQHPFRGKPGLNLRNCQNLVHSCYSLHVSRSCFLAVSQSIKVSSPVSRRRRLSLSTASCQAGDSNAAPLRVKSAQISS